MTHGLGRHGQKDAALDQLVKLLGQASAGSIIDALVERFHGRNGASARICRTSGSSESFKIVMGSFRSSSLDAMITATSAHEHTRLSRAEHRLSAKLCATRDRRVDRLSPVKL